MNNQRPVAPTPLHVFTYGMPFRPNPLFHHLNMMMPPKYWQRWPSVTTLGVQNLNPSYGGGGTSNNTLNQNVSLNVQQHNLSASSTIPSTFGSTSNITSMTNLNVLNVLNVVQPMDLTKKTKRLKTKMLSSPTPKRKKEYFESSAGAGTIKALALPPFPPNWNANLEDTNLSLARYKLFPVDRSSQEFDTIAMLMSQIKISGIEQIVNPTLWSRFLNTRKNMLQSKSDDLELLSKLGFDDKEIMRTAHLSFNFTKDPTVTAAPYNDNLALLFHCTSNVTNVDSILRDGLDERMVNSGLLGKGIYFSDDPFKSTQYDGCGGIIFIFGVLLGDCLSVNHLFQREMLVREPEKFGAQKRFHNDLFFDSIVGQTGIDDYNEYVIYNRFQCCPLYKITYAGSQYGTTDTTGNDFYFMHRKRLPTFSWIPLNDDTAMPNPSTSDYWPFYATTVFEQMVVKVLPDEVKQATPTKITQQSITEKLDILSSIGFLDSEFNLETLKKCEYNLDNCLNHLLDLESESKKKTIETAEEL